MLICNFHDKTIAVESMILTDRLISCLWLLEPRKGCTDFHNHFIHKCNGVARDHIVLLQPWESDLKYILTSSCSSLYATERSGISYETLYT